MTAPAHAAAPSQRIIVEWQPGVTSSDRLDTRDDADSSLVRTLGAPAFQLVAPQAGQSVAGALDTLREDPDVKLAVPDGFSTPLAVPNDPLFGYLWGLDNLGLGIAGAGAAIAGDDIDVLPAWDRTRGTPSTVIADIDSGYRFDAPDLAPVAWTNPGDPLDGLDNDHDGIVDDTHGADFVGHDENNPVTDGDPTEDDLIDGGHGVHTAGTMGAAGNNGIGISGVSQDVRIMPLRVCSYRSDDDGGGPHVGGLTCPFSAEIQAINYAGAHGARAANMSLGGTGAAQPVADAIQANPNVLFVIAAGNGGSDGIGDDNDTLPTYPCVYPLANIVCVAATSQADQLATFSNYGATSVDLGAPGTETLSTFPAADTLFSDDFEGGDFAGKWTATGANGGFAPTSESPLTSNGMSDTPGASPTPSTVRASTSAGVAVPAGEGACTLTMTLRVSVGSGDSFSYAVLSNGSQVAGTNISGSGPRTVALPVLAGTTAKVRFTFTAGSTVGATRGAWVDDVDLTCNAALTTPPSYGFLQGTSMAAPHVTGAAGLLFSLKPSASVAEVKAALLGTVHPEAALAGRTVSGGRLDVSAALDRLVPPDTTIASRPSATATSRHATFAFGRLDAAVAATFECQIDGDAFAPCTSPATYSVALGSHSFAVRARDLHGNADASPATATWKVTPFCIVPKLKGRTLRQATKALKLAHCALGKVAKPRKPKHHKLPPLVVKSSPARVGSRHAEGAKVKLTLGKKPPPKRRRHAQRR